jgi:tRNA (guanine37-N1)-methyltransferase
MKFDIVTIFPNIFDSYFGESILKRAQEKGAIEIAVHNLRDYTTDRHRTVDDTPYGGGAGMVLKVEPIFRAVQDVLGVENVQDERGDRTSGAVERFERAERSNVRVILFSAKGRRYTQADAHRLAQYDRLIMVCGRYEGVDERVAEHLIDEELSVGDYVLTGGEIPAMLVVDSVTRLLPGVLGNEESAQYESHAEDGVLEHPHYTKPEEFNGWRVPEVLLSGNHAEIEKWRKEHSRKIPNV